MDLSSWFTNQLNAGAEGFIWSVGQVPPERRLLAPPKHPGEWSVARHVFHMLYYEQNAVVPNMQIWLGQPITIDSTDSNEEAAWDDGKDVETMLADFRRVRAAQLEMLPNFNDQLWHETRETSLWGDVTLLWLVSKTFQHTAEHTHDVMRMALFWDR
ncbi:MAG TPA: DinB family protein [Ktedonobacteraceae bacterium]|nr:DinB family protein [Ktedonobacteraceae bacterium]